VDFWTSHGSIRLPIAAYLPHTQLPGAVNVVARLEHRLSAKLELVCPPAEPASGSDAVPQRAPIRKVSIVVNECAPPLSLGLAQGGARGLSSQEPIFNATKSNRGAGLLPLPEAVNEDDGQPCTERLAAEVEAQVLE